MSIPGVGALTALAFKTGIDVPQRFASPRASGPISGSRRAGSAPVTSTIPGADSDQSGAYPELVK
jgi:transposase